MNANKCNNIIHINYYGTDDENQKSSELIYNELKNKFEVYFNEHNSEGLICDYQFDSDWVSPTSFLKEISEKYKVDIIGVAYEFDDGYVDSFEILYKLDEIVSREFLETVTDPCIKEGVDTIVFPENELNILNEVLEDDINLSDKEILEWKEKELEDWQKRVIEERKELSEKIEKLKEFVNTNPDNNSIHILYEQLDAMIDYRFVLDFRISKFNEQ